MLNGGSSGLTPSPPVMCTADSFIYLWGFFFLVVGWFVGFLVFFKPWYRGGCRCTFRPAADHETELPVCPQQRGGGGVKTAGRLLTTVNAMVTPGGNLL